jgi:colanic acid/amylovoran biosynthesis glycosyltransferase
LRDGETGRLVAPGDAAGLARSVRALIDDPVERERLGAAAALDVRDRFAPGRLLAATHELYGRFS